MKACVYFHQGWSDIVNCISLINYYSNNYEEIFVIIRKDAKELINYYVKNLQNVNILYINNDDGRFYGNFELKQEEGAEYIPSDRNDFHGTIIINKDMFLAFHGEHDMYRNDKYHAEWYKSPNDKYLGNFVEKFYTIYDINYMERINSFAFTRNYDIENKIYEEFVSKNGENYVLYHDNPTWNYTPQNIATEIKFENKLEGFNYVNLNKMSNTLLDYIKVFEKAKEIYLIDSIWALSDRC